MITKEQEVKRLTHSDRILGMLAGAGDKGCTSAELSAVTWRFSGRIYDLRQLGHNIETREQDGAAVFILHLPRLELVQPSLFEGL